MNWITILIQIVTVLAFGYFYMKRKFSYWSSRGVKGPIPWTPIGNLLDFFREGQLILEPKWLKTYGKVYGYYQGFRPILTIMDVDLIKQVLVKDFPLFVNRQKNIVDHEIWSVNLFVSVDDQWKRIRAITSPSFTSGKLRGMHLLMNKCVDKLGDYFDQVISSNQGKMNAKEVITGFTIDVIASTSFATETNVYENQHENAFLKFGTNLVNGNRLKTISFFAFPRWFNRMIGNRLAIDMDAFNFFVNLSKTILDQRKIENQSGKSKAKRSDLVQLLMDAFVYESDLKESNYEKLEATLDEPSNEQSDQPKPAVFNSIKKSLTENELIAQSILFFVAGFETTATTISNSLYNLALNPEIQTRLYTELTQSLDGIAEESEQYFEVVNGKIPYLDAVIKETLRKTAPLSRLQRQVSVDGYKLGGITLEKDQVVDISVFGVHHCPDYYPEPERFNPDRFMPENKHLLVPYTYLPFGAGPRNCIGMRFAYQEIKLCLAKIVRQFEFHRTAETKIPLEYRMMGLMSSKDIQLRVSKRIVH